MTDARWRGVDFHCPNCNAVLDLTPAIDPVTKEVGVACMNCEWFGQPSISINTVDVMNAQRRRTHDEESERNRNG